MIFAQARDEGGGFLLSESGFPQRAPEKAGRVLGLPLGFVDRFCQALSEALDWCDEKICLEVSLEMGAIKTNAG